MTTANALLRHYYFGLFFFWDKKNAKLVNIEYKYFSLLLLYIINYILILLYTWSPVMASFFGARRGCDNWWSIVVNGKFLEFP